MLKNLNIIRILGIVMIAFSVMFTLTGCSEETANQSDKTDEQLAAEHRECWQDKILVLLYDTMGTVAMGTYSKLTEGAFALMMVAFAVWLAFTLLAYISSIKEESSGELWNQILAKFVICFACGTLASSTDGLLWVLNMILFPIYNAFLEFGGAVLTASSGVTANGNQTIEIFGETIEAGRSIVCKPEGMATASLTGFPDSPRNMMSCLICAVNEKLTLGNKLAFEVMRMKGFMVTVIGLIILVSFTIIKVSFVFYLVDTIFRFAMIIVLLPLLIMAYAFPFTKKWVKHGMSTVLNSGAFMMVIAILIAMAILAVIQVIKNDPATFNPQGEAEKAAFKELNPAVLSLLLIAFLVKGSLGVAQSITNKLVGGSSEAKFQKKMRAAVMMVGKLVLAWLTAGGSKAIEAVQKVKKVKETIDKVKNSHTGKAAIAAHRKFKDAQKRVQQVRNTMNSLAGRDPK